MGETTSDLERRLSKARAQRSAYKIEAMVLAQRTVAVRELHYENDYGECEHCERPAPCKTVRVLNGEALDESSPLQGDLDPGGSR